MESRVIPPAQASARQTEMGDRFNRVLFAALDALESRQIPYALIGGIAVSGMGRPRSTHDIDVFVRPEDAEAALDALGAGGFDIEKTDPRWLFKGWMEDQMVDIIFKSQGDIYFDTPMQEHARVTQYHGRGIRTVAPEDLIIIKAAVHAEVGPHHWHDALALLSHANIDWNYLILRARRAARRILALLIYAQANDIWIPNNVINQLYSIIYQNHEHKADTMQTPASSFVASSAPIAKAAPENKPEQKAEIKTEEAEPAIPKQIETYMIGHILDRLATDERTAAHDVQLRVGTKKILVKGEAPSEEQRRAIEEVIRDMAVGFDIENQIRIMKLSTPAVEEVV